MKQLEDENRLLKKLWDIDGIDTDPGRTHYKSGQCAIDTRKSRPYTLLMHKSTLGALLADSLIWKEVNQIKEDLSGLIAEYPPQEYSELLKEVRRVSGIVAKLRQDNLDLQPKREHQRMEAEDRLRRGQERQRIEAEDRLRREQERQRRAEERQRRAEERSRREQECQWIEAEDLPRRQKEQLLQEENLRMQQVAEEETRREVQKIAGEVVAKEREPLFRPESPELVGPPSHFTDEDLTRAEREMNLPANYRSLWKG